MKNRHTFNRLYLALIAVSALLLSSVASAEDNSPLIKLRPGLWQSKQVTTSNGQLLPLLSNSGNYSRSECLLKEDAQRSVDYYAKLLRKSLGNDAECSFNYGDQAANSATVQVACTMDGFSSTADVRYKYTDTEVNVTADGNISALGFGVPYQTILHSVWLRACTAEEKI